MPRDLTFGRKKSFVSYVIIFFLIVASFLFFAVFYLRVANYQYMTSMEVAPVSIGGDASTRPSMPSSPLLNLTQESAELSPFLIYQLNLKSFETASTLHADEEFLKQVFAESWDEEKEEWILPSGPISNLKNSLLSLVRYPIKQNPKPTEQALWNYLQNKITITEIDSSMSRVSVYSPDRAYGESLLLRLHKVADDKSRDFIGKNASSRLKLLEDHYKDATILAVREQLTGYMVGHMRTLATTKGGEFFAAELLQRPVSENFPSRPRPMVILVLAAVVGVLLAAMLLLTLTQFRFNRDTGNVIRK